MQYTTEYYATVSSNKDPLNKGRIKARVPAVLGRQIETAWAEPSTSVSGGPNFGQCFIPPVGSPVWITFREGDLDYPIYRWGWATGLSGKYPIPARSAGKQFGRAKGQDGFQNSSGTQISEPADPFAAEYPYNRTYLGESGILVEYDDTPSGERINLYHPSGSFVEIHPDGKVVLGSVNEVYMYGSNINLHANGDMNIGVSGTCDITCAEYSLNGGPPTSRIGDGIYVFPHTHPGAGAADAQGIIVEGSSNATVGG